jgi:hypothetical protein
VEAAGLRERLFRLEQRGMVVDTTVRTALVEHSE